MFHFFLLFFCSSSSLLELPSHFIITLCIFVATYLRIGTVLLLWFDIIFFPSASSSTSFSAFCDPLLFAPNLPTIRFIYIRHCVFFSFVLCPFCCSNSAVRGAALSSLTSYRHRHHHHPMRPPTYSRRLDIILNVRRLTFSFFLIFCCLLLLHQLVRLITLLLPPSTAPSQRATVASRCHSE